MVSQPPLRIMRALIHHPDAPVAWFFFAITFTILIHVGR
jgi:hypothetical protein